MILNISRISDNATSLWVGKVLKRLTGVLEYFQIPAVNGGFYELVKAREFKVNERAMNPDTKALSDGAMASSGLSFQTPSRIFNFQKN